MEDNKKVKDPVDEFFSDERKVKETQDRFLEAVEKYLKKEEEKKA